MSHIRLSLIKLDELLTIVRNSNLVPADALLDAINDQNNKKSSDLGYRGFLFPNKNIATSAWGAAVVAGEIPTALLANEGHVVDQDRSCTRHAINDRDPGIILEVRWEVAERFVTMWFSWDDRSSSTTFA